MEKRAKESKMLGVVVKKTLHEVAFLLHNVS